MTLRGRDPGEGVIDIILAGGARTPFGEFGGSLGGIPLSELSAHAARASVQRAGIHPNQVDHLVFGNTLGPDSDAVFTSRVVALKAGLAETSGALAVNRACGSGLQALISAGMQISAGHSEIALAGGGESYSRAPHVVNTARWGKKRGSQELADMLDWVYRCPISGGFMGDTAENLALEFDHGRERMDEWALMSQHRASSAIESGFLARQIVPIHVPEGKARRLLEHDECPRAGLTLEKLRSLRPAFRKDGLITAGNSSCVTDGAAFIVVASSGAAKNASIRPEARLVDWSCVGVPPASWAAGRCRRSADFWIATR